MSDPYAIPSERRPSLAALVPAVRREVDAWRAANYPGASATTARLLEHWFLDEHRTRDGAPFRYYFAQREAVESAIYLYEVVGVRSPQALSAHFDTAIAAETDFARFVVKMATGSGKTKVMSLLVAWAYLHAVLEPGSDLPTTFLLIAPNIIVYERLREDFADGAIFRTDPVVPPEFARAFGLVVSTKGDPVPPGASGVLALTNIQALYERRAPARENPVGQLLGPRPPARLDAPEPLLAQIARRGRVMVLNDEAHHLHDEVKSDTGEPLVAWQTIQHLHQRASVALQLDVSATPKNQQGRLFGEIVSDYPLAAAIEDAIVKRPIIGELGGEIEATSDDASVRYRARLAAGVAKWREFHDLWAPTGRTPLLFVMAENTAAADQIASYLETLDGLTGRVLKIQTRNNGEFASQRELERVRAEVRRVDEADSPYSAVVSVLMLREGWDVRNVTVIVPLRAYTAKAQILPEQTLGRGLRRVSPPDSGVIERLVVIEHEAFRTFWDAAAEQEGLELEFERAEQVHAQSVLIAVEAERMGYDLEIPQLPRVVTRSVGGLADLRLQDIPARRLRLPDTVRQEAVDYTGRDMLSGEVVEHDRYPYPATGNRDDVLGWYVRMIQSDARLTGQFSVLAPLVEGWVESRAFGGPVSFADPLVLQSLSEPAVQAQVFAVFRQALDDATLESRDAAAGEVKTLRLSATRPYLWSGETAAATKSVFNHQPCDSGLEVRTVAFLDRCADVAAFAKLGREVRFSLDYRNDDGRLAFYYPDFVAKLLDDTHIVLETKGLVDVDVARKDERARRWASEATSATGITWQYHRLDQDVFDRYESSVANLRELLEVLRAQHREATLASLPPARRRTREELVAIMNATLARGEVTGVDDAIQQLRDEPRGR